MSMVHPGIFALLLLFMTVCVAAVLWGSSRKNIDSGRIVTRRGFLVADEVFNVNPGAKYPEYAESCLLVSSTRRSVAFIDASGAVARIESLNNHDLVFCIRTGKVSRMVGKVLIPTVGDTQYSISKAFIASVQPCVLDIPMQSLSMTLDDTYARCTLPSFAYVSNAFARFQKEYNREAA